MPMKKRSCAVRGFGFLIIFSVSLLGFTLPVRAADASGAENLYKRTNFEGSLALLDKRTTNAEVNFLIGRDYYMLADFKKAAEYLQKAADEQLNSSEIMDWLGRAYGKRAQLANPLMAPGLASKARQAFERAVELDGSNREALSDLFEYYLNAPSFLGGGYQKATGVANRMTPVDPSEAYSAQAKLAQKHQQYQAAEEHLRQAVAVAPRQVGRLIDLAKFLAKQGRTSESDAVFAEAEKLNPNSPKLWFARADVLIQEKRDIEQAKLLLEKYVNSPITVNDPPREEALRLLKQAGGA